MKDILQFISALLMPAGAILTVWGEISYSRQPEHRHSARKKIYLGYAFIVLAVLIVIIIHFFS